MSIALALMCGVAAFLVGFALGILYGNPPKGAPQRAVNVPDTETLRRLNEEYRNFLSYDGSEQT